MMHFHSNTCGARVARNREAYERLSGEEKAERIATGGILKLNPEATAELHARLEEWKLGISQGNANN